MLLLVVWSEREVSQGSAALSDIQLRPIPALREGGFGSDAVLGE